MGSNLVERLDGVGHLKDEIYAAFSVPHIDVGEEYKNKRLSPNYSPQNFRNYMKASFNVDEKSCKKIQRTLGKSFKYITYGGFSLGRLPKDFINSLENWEKAYFLVGRWAQGNPDFEMPLALFTLDHLCQGIKKLNFLNNHKGKKLPFSGEILDLAEKYFLVEKQRKEINKKGGIQMNLF